MYFSTTESFSFFFFLKKFYYFFKSLAFIQKRKLRKLKQKENTSLSGKANPDRLLLSSFMKFKETWNCTLWMQLMKAVAHLMDSIIWSKNTLKNLNLDKFLT
jgi:hypothetical protein